MRKKKNPVTNNSEGVYLSDVSPNDKPWDKHRASSEIIEQMYSDLGYARYPERLNDCSKLLEFALQRTGDDLALLKLYGAKFCRVRWCSVCKWRRSLMWRARFFKTIPAITADYPNHQFLFLTLTVKNCEVSNLRETINWMNKSFDKLRRRKSFPANGFVKAIEVTKSEDGLAHPHFHCILIVPQDYFRGSKYINQKQWIQLWKKSLKADYNPIVDVRKVKLSNSRHRTISKRLNRELTDNDIVFYGLMECLKYSVKESDLMSDPAWLDAITQQLHKTRAIALGGIFKQYLSEDEPEDLINTELEENLEVLDTDARFLFGWKEKVKRYQSL